ncbi:trypsin-7-like [Homalodisca vitripennis]|nr:trypsin-7-like [Homalodisca vitripennis]
MTHVLICYTISCCLYIRLFAIRGRVHLIMARIALGLLLLGAVAVLGAELPSGKVLYHNPNSPPGANNLGMYKGKGTTVKKHPYIVAVTYYDSFNCAGNIIGTSWVFLSGDCTYGYDPSSVNVIAGTNDGSSGKKYDVKQLLAHPNYPDAFLDYDYGLIQVSGKFKWSSTIKPVSLPKQAPKAGSKVIITGWGATGSNTQLQQGTMKVISNKQCAKIYADFGITFTDRMGCVYNKGKTTPCDGDWSDPITKGKTLYHVFTAIATSGECSSEAYPAICASVYPALSWIKNVTGIE